MQTTQPFPCSEITYFLSRAVNLKELLRVVQEFAERCAGKREKSELVLVLEALQFVFETQQAIAWEKDSYKTVEYLEEEWEALKRSKKLLARSETIWRKLNFGRRLQESIREKLVREVSGISVELMKLGSLTARKKPRRFYVDSHKPRAAESLTGPWDQVELEDPNGLLLLRTPRSHQSGWIKKKSWLTHFNEERRLRDKRKGKERSQYILSPEARHKDPVFTEFILIPLAKSFTKLWLASPAAKGFGFISARELSAYAYETVSNFYPQEFLRGLTANQVYERLKKTSSFSEIREKKIPKKIKYLE